MNGFVFSLNLFVFFKCMQKLVELNDYVARFHEMPNLLWLLRGGGVNDPLAVRTGRFYAFLSWVFLIITILLLFSDSLDFGAYELIPTLGKSLVIFICLVFRATPYVRNIKENIEVK